MKYSHLPGIDKPISRLVQGTVMCAPEKQDYVNELLDAVYATGINTFDTAHGYGSGKAERSLGAWINSRGLRDKVVILGKGCHHNQDRRRVTPHDISSDIADSLARLQTDYIDLYVLHRDDLAVPVGPIIERLNEHKAQGHIHAFGGSNWTPARLAEANAYAAAHGLEGMTVSSPNFSLAEQAHEPWDNCVTISGPAYKTDREWYAAQGMPLFTWSSLAGGFFSGRFTPDNLDSFSDNYFDQLCVEVYCFGDNWGRLERAKELAARKNASLAQIAVAYVLNQPMDTYAIIASWQPAEAADSAGAADIELTEEEIKWLEG